MFAKLSHIIGATKSAISNIKLPSLGLPHLTGIQRLFESLFLFTVLFTIFSMVALYSFDSRDPSWSQTAWNGAIHNSAGIFGAYVADCFFFAFGKLAYYVPPFLFIGVGYILLKIRRLIPFADWDFFAIGSNILGSLLLLVSSCMLADVNFDDIWFYSSGGTLGRVVSGNLLPYLHPLGVTLSAIFAWVIGFTLVTGISFLTIVDTIGEWAIRLCVWVLDIFNKKKHPLHEESDVQEQESQIQVEPDDALLNLQSVPEEVEEIEVKEMVQAIDAHDEQIDDEPLIILNKETEANIILHNDDGMSELERAELEVGIEDDEIDEIELANEIVKEVEQETSTDRTAELAHEMLMKQIEAAQEKEQENMAGTQHPFLMKKDQALPVPETPLPTVGLLDAPPENRVPVDIEALKEKGRLLELKLNDYKIKAKVVGIEPGPVITRFELDLAPGVKVSKLTSLSKDIARSLSALAVRVVEIIPGKPYVGLELPNVNRETVYLSEVVGSEKFTSAKSPLAVVLGKDIGGTAVVADLAKMPHLLVAGTTGSGKSVGVNVMILSMLYKATPEDVRFIMIDPKMLELSIYEGIPHLLTEVVTDMKDAGNALRWCVGEMERRYKLMSALGVRSLKGFNDKIKQAEKMNHPIPDPLWSSTDSMAQEPPTLEKLPNIVVIVDEFADLMMVVGKKVEELIARLAQKARAAGIHLILATQRPSVDVITGLIKANIPSRVAFTVSTRTDSRTILDQGGAESLLGMGDMLYLPVGASHPVRVHGAFVDDHEVHNVVNDWKGRGEPNYIDEILNDEQGEETLLPGESAPASDSDLDALFDQVAAFVAESRRSSVSGVQRRFSIGFNRAARIVEQLEAHGIVSAPARNGSREVLVPPPAEM